MRLTHYNSQDSIHFKTLKTPPPVMQIHIIAAVARNRAIGYQNQLLYYLPEDLKRFKKITSGHTIIMGLNTYKSLPNGALPNRRNIVLARSVSQLEGCECHDSIDKALAACCNEEDIYIIGGQSIYRLFIEKADTLLLTEINDTPEKADTFFPEYDNWKECEREHHEKDEKHKYDFDFVTYRRF